MNPSPKVLRSSPAQSTRALRSFLVPCLAAAWDATLASSSPAWGSVEACLFRPWPGNVRELLGEARRAAREATASGTRSLRAEHLDAEAGLPLEGPTEAASASPAPTAPDRATLEATLAAHGGNVSAAARALGLHRTQVYRLMQRWGLGST